jgi:3D (Asp-Asp-Asp) domain-containing protein
MRVVLTAYSSTVSQTDSTPFITANGTYVSDGIVANNGLPFGTEIRIPELFGGKVFSVQDRMHWRKSDYQFDIWFPTYEQAKSFGVKYAYAEILKK